MLVLHLECDRFTCLGDSCEGIQRDGTTFVSKNLRSSLYHWIGKTGLQKYMGNKMVLNHLMPQTVEVSSVEEEK